MSIYSSTLCSSNQCITGSNSQPNSFFHYGINMVQKHPSELASHLHLKKCRITRLGRMGHLELGVVVFFQTSDYKICANICNLFSSHQKGTVLLHLMIYCQHLLSNMQRNLLTTSCTKLYLLIVWKNSPATVMNTVMRKEINKISLSYLITIFQISSSTHSPRV
jgi:hypothetical protein